MKKAIGILVIMTILMFFPSFIESAVAQPVPPDIDPEVPIDGGLTALLLAGLAYGARKLKAEKE